MSFFISPAYAEGISAGPDSGIFNIIFLVGFGLIFYFFMWRPQAKRAKDHKSTRFSCSSKRHNEKYLRLNVKCLCLCS